MNEKLINALKQTFEENQLEGFDEKGKYWVICLRHHGCTFTRQALDELSQFHKEIQAKGWQIILVHMGSKESFCELAYDYLQSEEWISLSDPKKKIYKALEINRGSLSRVLGPKEWVEGIRGLAKGYGIGALQGDGLQLSGMGLVDQGELVSVYQSDRASDSLPFQEFIESAAFDAEKRQ